MPVKVFGFYDYAWVESLGRAVDCRFVIAAPSAAAGARAVNEARPTHKMTPSRLIETRNNAEIAAAMSNVGMLLFCLQVEALQSAATYKPWRSP